jgi:hypothetical protein
LKAIPAYLLGPDNLIAFTPAAFLGKDVAITKNVGISAEINLCHPMGWNEYDQGGGLILTPRVGLSRKKGRSMMRIMAGLSTQALATMDTRLLNQTIPSFHIEFGGVLGKGRVDQTSSPNADTAVDRWDAYGKVKEPRRKKEEVYRHLRYKDADRHALTTDPLGILLSQTIGINYSYKVSPQISVGVSPQLAYSDYSTKIGATVAANFYLKNTYYGWYVPLMSGVVPASIVVSETSFPDRVTKTTSDAIYLYAVGSGLGFHWCFDNGFIVNPSFGLGYPWILSEPTQEFKNKMRSEFYEDYDDYINQMPPIIIGFGLAIGLTF